MGGEDCDTVRALSSCEMRYKEPFVDSGFPLPEMETDVLQTWYDIPPKKHFKPPVDHFSILHHTSFLHVFFCGSVLMPNGMDRRVL